MKLILNFEFLLLPLRTRLMWSSLANVNKGAR